jgi:predicted glutamine amidotransferase
MCRLFGFRSVIPSHVHSSLLNADNALGTQSNDHPDGWGVAYYVDGSPHVTKSPTHALGDQLFHRLSGVVSSETVLAHVRKATQGDKGLLNCHPFQFGRWVFAHNGDIPRFADRFVLRLRQEISPRLRRFVLGDTDSETIFFIFLSLLEGRVPLRERAPLGEVVAALKLTLELVRGLCEEPGAEKPVLLTCIVTDGDNMVAAQGGKELAFSTYKTRCPERDHCGSLSGACEGPSTTGQVNHLIVSSERLQGFNVWEDLAPGDILAVDARMRVVRTRLGRRTLTVLGAVPPQRPRLPPAAPAPDPRRRVFPAPLSMTDPSVLLVSQGCR